MNPERKKSPAIVAIIVIVLLAIAGGAVYVATRPSETATTQTITEETSAEAPSTPDSSSDAVASSYANGTYKATGSYSTPGGRESVDLTVTITDGVITATEIDGSATSGDSLQYQTRFINNYETLVVGKSVDEVSLSRVAGSSLTSGGFNEALEQIKADAEA